MKRLFFYLSIILSVSIIAANCTQNEVESPEPEKMTAQELKAKHGIVFPNLEYEGDEVAASAPNGKGAKKKANAVAVVLWFYDLGINITGTTIVGDVSANAQWAGGQKFVDTTTTTGAIGLWACGRLYDSPPGAGTTTTCQTEGAGYYRVYSSDFDYTVHLSEFKRVE
jgi:hypothetical protein